MAKNNHAFIDAQNLHLATTKASIPWKIDLHRFRIYLKEKYQVSEAYFFLGAYNPELRDMYTAIQRYGFILIFREHGHKLIGKKKGNVDVDIVFSIMRKLYEREAFDNILLVSGDGDYKRMVDYLIKESRFEMLLLPCREYASSLYKNLPPKYYDYIDRPDMRVKIGLREK
jgi:uncharacterized LabA/DUF88 family protein